MCFTYAVVRIASAMEFTDIMQRSAQTAGSTVSTKITLIADFVMGMTATSNNTILSNFSMRVSKVKELIYYLKDP